MTDKPTVLTPTSQPAPDRVTRPIIVEPGGRVPVVGVACVLSNVPARRPDPRVRTR